MNNYVPKPIEPGELGAALTTLLPGPASQPPKSISAGTCLPDAPIAFDENELVARLSGDKALAHEIVSGFLSDVPAQLEALSKLTEAGDAKGAALQAHSLKGAAATVSATALRETSLQIEQAAVSGNLSSVAFLLAQLSQQLERLKVVLSQTGWA